MSESIIERLFAMNVEQFRAKHWPDVPLHHPGRIDRLAELTSEPALRDVATLIASKAGRARVHRIQSSGDLDQESIADPATMLRRFEGGGMLDMQDVQRTIPAVHDWLQRIARELFLEHLGPSLYCQAFISPAGTGLPKHFDNREIIVVQLVGRKRWLIARNRALPTPMMPHVAGGHLDPLNRDASPDVQVRDMPDDAVEHVLAPGGALFVPRGWWHTTWALEDSLSLSFGLRVPSWAELFVKNALQQLASDPAWRAAAFDLTKVRPQGADELVAGMKRAIAELRAAPPPAARDEQVPVPSHDPDKDR